MTSLICNWFHDWGRSIRAGLGQVGLIIFMVAFACIGAMLIYGIIKHATITIKRKIEWGYLFILIIIILFFIWFATLV